MAHEARPTAFYGEDEESVSHEYLVDRELGHYDKLKTFLNEASLTFGGMTFHDGNYRFGMICGPTHAVAVRLLSEATGIPFQDYGSGERLELCTGYYWPEDIALASDHTFIKHHNGQGLVSYIDYVYPLAWSGAVLQQDRVQELVNYRQYPSEEFDRHLAEDFKLYPFDESTPSAVWDHPIIGLDFGDLEECRRFTRDINRPRIDDMPDVGWHTQATVLLERWRQYEQSPSERPITALEWEEETATYSRPVMTPAEHGMVLSSPPDSVPWPISAYHTARVSRQRYEHYRCA